MVARLKELIEQQQPDLLVIAGDIYDVAAPSTSAQKIFISYILELKQAAPQMPIVCISGNHDSSSRHEIFQEPWEAFNVHMIGKIDMADLRNNIIRVPGKGWVVAVPYTNERFLDDEFYQKLEETVKETVTDNLPVVYVGHAAIQKFDFTGHSDLNGRYIGGIECISLEQLGSCYDYIALGHIHKAQTMGNARYCGSPLPVSFDEVRPGYEHGFTVVEIEAKGDNPKLEHISLEMIKPLVNIPSEGFAPWAEVIKELKDFPADMPAYIRLNVLLKDNEMLPYDKDAQISMVMEGKQAEYALVNPTRELSITLSRDKVQVQNLTMEELHALDPKVILKQHASKLNMAFTNEFEEMFEIVIRNLNTTGDED